jgi:hypothetical protein
MCVQDTETVYDCACPSLYAMIGSGSHHQTENAILQLPRLRRFTFLDLLDMRYLYARSSEQIFVLVLISVLQ